MTTESAERERSEMVIRNTSRYPTETVREIVKFATAEVDMRRVCVNVKNRWKAAYAGWAYDYVPSISNAPPSSEYLVTLGIGPEEKFPMPEHKRHQGAGTSFPVRRFDTWQEALVFLAAHEAIHIEQFRERLPRSEVQCDAFADHVLRRWRESQLPTPQ